MANDNAEEEKNESELPMIQLFSPVDESELTSNSYCDHVKVRGLLVVCVSKGSEGLSNLL